MITQVATGAFGRGFAGETVAAPSVNPWAAARATVDTATGAFTTANNMVLDDLHPPGFQLFEEAAGYWKVIQYPDALYACNAENMKKISFRGDFWVAAQVSLARMHAAANTPAPFGGPLPAVGTPERRYVAALFADWYVTVMSWVSLAAYSANIQPAFLCPDAPVSTTGADGQATFKPLLLPTRSIGDGLPADLESIRREIKALDSSGKPGSGFISKWFEQGYWGPMWMGFYDRGEATGWLKGSFKPHTDPAAVSLQQGNGGVAYVYPNRSARPLPPSTSWTTVRNRIADPWYQVYYSLLWFDFSELMVDWRQRDETGVDATNTRWMLGPGAHLRIAKAWCRWVCEQKIMDVILTSVNWYSKAYFAYWNSKGLLTFSPSQARDAQVEIERQKMALRQQSASGAINSINSTAVSLTVALAPVPWAGAVAAGCALLIGGITALICRRRRKKRITVPLMQPLMLRSLSNPDCNYFKPTDTMEGSVTKLLGEVKNNAAALEASPAGVVPSTRPDDPLGSGTPPSSGTVADSVAPTAKPTVSGGSTAGGPLISTSTSSSQPATPAIPSVQQIEAQAVQASQTPPTSSGVAPVQTINWPVIGLGAVATAAVIVALRRR